MRLRNFAIGRKLADDEIVGIGGLERVGELVASLVPFVSLLFPILNINGTTLSLDTKR
jgi:hypothetical protein